MGGDSWEQEEWTKSPLWTAGPDSAGIVEPGASLPGRPQQPGRLVGPLHMHAGVNRTGAQLGIFQGHILHST